jgi:spore maturation protein CgeB
MRDVTPGWYFDMAEYVSITTFSNMQDVANLRAMGFKSDFLQIGIDPEVFSPDGEKMDVPEIVFMANNYGNQFPLSRFRVQVVDFLKDNYGGRFKVFGNGWKPGEQSLNHSQYEEAKAYRGAKIAISVSHFNSDRYTSDRMFRALACGTCVLSHQYEGIEKDFSTEVLRMFKNTNELKAQIDYLLGHPEERIRIAETGCKYAHQTFSYKNMVQHILTLAK